MKFADSVKQSASLTSTATISLGAVVAGYRTLAQAIADTAGKPEQVAVGDVVCMRVDDAADATKFEIAEYTIGGTAQAPTLTRVAIRTSSAGGTVAVTFSGAVTVLCTMQASFIATLPVPRDVAFSQSIPLAQPGSSYMPQQTVAGALTFTPAASAVRGALVYLRLVANGTNIPDCTAFKQWGAGADYDNRNGIVNVIQFFYDGYDYWYSISQQANAVAVAPAATAITMSGPTSGTVAQASSNFTVTLSPSGGTSTGVTVTPTPVTGVTFNPTSVQLSTAAPSATFTASASTAGSYSIAVTNNGSLTNPAAIIYTAYAAASTAGVPLAMTSASYNPTGKFGNSLNGGYGTATNLLPASNAAYTVAGWVKTTASGSSVALAGQGGCLWVGVDTNGNAIGRYGQSADVGVTSTTKVNDNNWHYLEFATDGTKGLLFVDGVLVNTVTQTATIDTTSAANRFGVRWLPFGTSAGGGGLNFPGEVDDVAVFSGMRHTATYALPTASTSPSEANLLALWSLDGNGTDSTSRTVDTSIRLSPRSSDLTESGTGPYTYTGTGAAYSDAASNYVPYLIGGVATKKRQVGTDGSLSFKATGTGTGAEIMLGLSNSTSVVGFKDLPCAFFNQASNGKYVPFTSGVTQTAANSVTAADTDVRRLRWTGTTVVGEVSKDNGTTWTTIYSWTGVSASAINPQCAVGTAAGTITNLTGVGLA